MPLENTCEVLISSDLDVHRRGSVCPAPDDGGIGRHFPGGDTAIQLWTLGLGGHCGRGSARDAYSCQRARRGKSELIERAAIQERAG
jgi:hypothetical protein